LGRRYGAKIVGYYFESEVRRCLERNQQRIGKARVPNVALYATAKKLVPPSYPEEFDELFYVRITGDSAFDIRAYASEADVHQKPGC
jgi:predicted kinase